jgi:hypothetical protein
MPAARACPYSSRVLGRDPTRPEQRAARHDSRRDDLDKLHRYFDVLTTNRLAFIIDPTQVGAVTGLAAHDADRAAAVLRGGAVLVALNRGYADLWPAPTPYPIAVPWLNVGIAVLVVPLVAMLGAGLLTRSILPIERRL